MFSTCDIGLGETLLADIWPGQEQMAPAMVPSYLNDLNAMHEAEKTLNREQANTFNGLLMDLKKPRSEMTSESEKWSWHSEAVVRAEAFLRTKGLWTA